MVVVGATVIEAVVAPPGVQRYVPPVIEGVAVKVTDVPEQIAAGVFIVIDGFGYTVINLVIVQPKVFL